MLIFFFAHLADITEIILSWPKKQDRWRFSKERADECTCSEESKPLIRFLHRSLTGTQWGKRVEDISRGNCDMNASEICGTQLDAPRWNAYGIFKQCDPWCLLFLYTLVPAQAFSSLSFLLPLRFRQIFRFSKCCYLLSHSNNFDGLCLELVHVLSSVLWGHFIFFSAHLKQYNWRIPPYECNIYSWHMKWRHTHKTGNI